MWMQTHPDMSHPERHFYRYTDDITQSNVTVKPNDRFKHKYTHCYKREEERKQGAKWWDMTMALG